MAETKDRDEQQQDERFDQFLKKETARTKVFDLTCNEAQVDAILSEGEST